MVTEILVAIMALLGTAIGTVGGILTSNKLTTHRIGQLECKVDKHNNMMERLYIVEEKAKSAHIRIDELRQH